MGVNLFLDIRFRDLSSRDNAFAVSKKFVPSPFPVNVEPGRFS
jgi:hypothetical protein